MNRKHLLMLIGAVILFSTATTFAGSQVTVLTNQQADEIVGAWFACNTCKVLSSGCADYHHSCDGKLNGQACTTQCSPWSGIADAACRYMLLGPGCRSLPSTNCGTNRDGFCMFQVCEEDLLQSCGNVTNCETVH